MATTLDLKHVVDVTVSVSPTAAPRAEFNQLLIVGSTDVITVEERIKSYESTAEMLADGFVNTDAEYLAALKYFAQSPAPDTVWIGRRDNTISPEESVLEAIEACRAAESDWYIVYSTEAVAADIEDIALSVETMTPSTIFVYNSSDADILVSDPSPDDIATTLKGLSYSRTMGMYCSTAHAVAGIVGVACGLNTGTANSAFTLFGKTITGVATDDLTSSQRGIVEAKNCNVYLSYANYYSIYENGVMANGYFFDQILNRDMLVNDIQLACMDLLYGNRKIPQTESGMAMIYNALQKTCELAVARGHLGPGTYTGVSFLNLNTDDAMPNGYIIQSGTLSAQSAADRALRKAVPFYITIKEAGAVHSMTIEVIVNV